MMSESKAGGWALLTGGVAVILASTCCLGPLLLVALGFSSAWISSLAVLEPYRPIFIGVALLSVLFAWRRIYRPAARCKPDEVCALPRVSATYSVIFWIAAALVVIALAITYILPLFC